MPQHQREKLANCVKLLLLWVAASDGKLEESELEFASSQFSENEVTITTDDFLAVIRNSDVQTIEQAIRTVAGESRELRNAFLDMAITMAMADREIAIAENHILRFYADALHLGIGILERRFQAIAGRALPDPGDPSSPEWWEQEGDRLINTGGHEDAGDEENEAPSPWRRQRGPRRMTIGQAHTLLGVSLNASQEDIEHAYQHMAGIFQVDRVEAMGETAVTVANARFKKIQEAYRLLRK